MPFVGSLTRTGSMPRARDAKKAEPIAAADFFDGIEKTEASRIALTVAFRAFRMQKNAADAKEAQMVQDAGRPSGLMTMSAVDMRLHLR